MQARYMSISVSPQVYCFNFLALLVKSRIAAARALAKLGVARA
jgi:hypothetical protein